MEEVWSGVHNAGCKPTAGSRPVKRGGAPHPGVAWAVSAAMLTIGMIYLFSTLGTR